MIELIPKLPESIAENEDLLRNWFVFAERMIQLPS
jgi:hypothetical protein